MGLLDEWFGPRQTAEPQLDLPETCAWVSVYDDEVVIAERRDRQRVLRGREAEEAKLALAGRTWRPKLHRSRNGCPIYFK